MKQGDKVVWVLWASPGGSYGRTGWVGRLVGWGGGVFEGSSKKESKLGQKQ